MKSTETTSRLVYCLTQARAIDLDKLFASAVDVEIGNYTEDRPEHVERVSIPAEHFFPVKEALIKSLELTIKDRVQRLKMDLSDCEKVLGKAERSKVQG